jgi:UPF0755 protein
MATTKGTRRMGKHFSDSPKGTPRQESATPVYHSHTISSRTAEMTRGVHGKKRDNSPTPRKGGKLPVVLIIAAALALLAVVCFVVLPALRGGDESSSDSKSVTITIPDGSGASDIAQILVENEVIDDSSEFTSAVEQRNASSSLKSGTYDLTTHMDVDDVIDQLIEGPNNTDNQVTIPEGKTVEQTAAIIEDSLGISSDDFIAQAKASNYVDDYPFLAGAQNDSLEGFLYPKTYDFSGTDVTADTVIRAMLDQYQAEVASLDFASAEAQIKETYGLEVDDYDILTMASIIEREAVTDEDRPLVSSVFYNRMKDGMYLQSDATMMYVTGGEVTAEDLETDSPYNTYLNLGLPPTPICSPSLASIKAAMEPADTNYYYFYIVEDGETSVHAFSETYEQHQQVIAENS